MRNKRNAVIYSLLVLGWIVVVVWQIGEHNRFIKLSRTSLEYRARATSRALSLGYRSQPFSLTLRDRLEDSLNLLVDESESGEILAVAVLNEVGEVVAASKRPLDSDPGEFSVGDVIWTPETMTLVNLVALGSEDDAFALILDPRTSSSLSAYPRPTSTTLQGFPRGEGDGSRFRMGAGRPDDQGKPEDRPRPDDRFRREDQGRPDYRNASGDRFGREGRPTTGTAISRPDGERMSRGSGRGGRGPWRPHRPYWMSPEQYKEMLQKRGLHKFVLTMSTQSIVAEAATDFWLRLAVGGFTFLSALGFFVGWRGIDKSNELQLRLMRAKEMNTHLREKNIAAAGLAHETRNPLNLIRGLAQMITKEADGSTEVKRRSGELIEEVDRVTSRLNAFIDYSKPREAKPAPTNVADVIRDVLRTLESDREDQGIDLSLVAPDLIIQADESLLRQVIFNLLINAFEAVEHGGKVAVILESDKQGEVALVVSDDGPGVPSEAREDIFRPYFTLHAEGTGLGLAVVWQIVRAHHWEIQYRDSEQGGAAFRITGLEAVAHKTA